MNREILFKAKRKDNCEWIEGNYVYEEYSKKHYITKQLENTHQLIEVIPETISQYTGLNDKNGVKIFEGDILQGIDLKFIVKWNKNVMGFGLYSKELEQYLYSNVTDFILYEVIGNIFDEEVK